MQIKKGEIWRVESRSFTGIIELLEDVPDTDADQFFKAKIFEGKTHYLNREDLGEGKEISLRTGLTRWRKKMEEENATANA